MRNAPGVEFLIRWLNDHALVEGQDYQWDAFLSVPEVDSVMWMLGAARDARAVSALTAKLEDCSPGAACFSNVRAVTTALGRIGSPKAAPALYRFLSQDGVHGHVGVAGDPQSLKSEFFVKAYIELHAAAALFRCGDHQDLGRQTLEGYLDDWRGIFVRYAGHTLETKKY